MKVLKVAGNSITVSILFCLILISGEMFGGVYLMYLFMGLSSLQAHSIVGLLGLLAVNLRYKSPDISNLFKIAGVILMLISLIIFFLNDKDQYNAATFHQTVPIVSFILFFLSILCVPLYMLQKRTR
jgi:hypothetical protein